MTTKPDQGQALHALLRRRGIYSEALQLEIEAEIAAQVAIATDSLRRDYTELQVKCGLCICAGGATDECCPQCIPGPDALPDVFESLRLARDGLLPALAFSVWYVNAWERDPYEHDEADIARMWTKFRDEWMPSLTREHCGDCTKVACACTRCHTEAYMKYAAIVARVTANGKSA